MEFKKIVKKLDPRLKAIVRRLDGKYTAFNDDDLYQEAMLYLWEKHKARELEDKTDSFILQGCFFNMKNYIRTVNKTIDKNSMSLNIPLNEGGDTLESLLTDSEAVNTFDAVEGKILSEKIKGMLDVREMKVFSMNCAGLTTREIGKRIGISHVMVGKINKKIRYKCKELKKENIF
ncbi:MAG: sigma-70 family RNA polymerase sigma factor [Candidatus Omnitrophota bacterium]